MALADMVNTGAQALRRRALQSVVPPKKKKQRRVNRRVVYNLTSAENEELQIEKHGLSKEDNWCCHKCKLMYSDDRGASDWTSCDNCPNKVHIKCVKNTHKTSQKLKFKMTLPAYDYICETCCNRRGKNKCCRSSEI